MLLALLMMLIVGISACDAGLEVVDLEIISYPNKIVYVKDVDITVSSDGLIVKSTSRDGQSLQGPGYLYPEDVSEVDLTKEGVYTVTMKLNNGVTASFPVQVVSKEWMQQYLEE